MIFSPNEVFSKYISNVLPELGEENVLQTTFSDFASAYIKGFKKLESFTDFIERYYKNNDITDEEYKNTKYKMSNEFKNIIDTYINQYKENISFTKSIIINGKTIKIEELNKLLKSKFDRLPLLERFDRITEYFCEQNNISYKKYGNTINKKIKSIINCSLDIKEIYKDIANFEDDNKLKYEDLIPLMYIYFEINGYPKNNSIKHIIIDEAQDYSLLQFSMLKKIFHKSSFTILGDINQTINPYYLYNSLNEINEIFDNKSRYIELNKTYRSSEEIIEFTNKILGLNNACSVRKNNSIPVTTRNVSNNHVVNQIINDINEMKERGIKRIAIITKNVVETNELYEKLKKYIDDINIIYKNTTSSIGNLVILPSYISKGLEFDGVISYTDINNEYNEKEKYLFYVVCTRAQHDLTVYNQKTLRLGRKNDA